MRYIILADNTRINGCLDGTTAFEVMIQRSNFTKAGEEADKINATNTARIRVFDSETDEEVSSGVDLIFSGLSINASENGAVVRFTTRTKTELETMHDEISELQEVVLEG